MTKDEVLNELYDFGNEGTKSIYIKHGANEPLFGVKVGDLKKVKKKTKIDHNLALELYHTGNSDAMYLAGLICKPKALSKEELQEWAELANWYLLSEYTVAAVAAESNFGWEMGKQWITSDQENIASTGWSTLASCVAMVADENLNYTDIDNLLNLVEKKIHSSKNRVRYTMNGFLISVGCYLIDYTGKALSIAREIGKVDVFMGDTSCKVPLAEEYILKVKNMDRIGKKKKKARC
ncbi:DNA alkylation repair protein [Flammeovirga pectinis]|uniref:DNA alkylation repair protein n=1 Tax=Flammeovirga pectinis TaxID=2494373 RepID=A0A3S9NZH8_9BACT|nr:DNA alkylation repair protein [Flammeovirga pectinis]AZQ61336.1 DNA alkylation repair protein [Flammeovirga pectinis]